MSARSKKSRGFRSLSSVLEEVSPAFAAGTNGRLSTGLIALDQFTAGLSPGHLVVVGSRPEVGKTSFALAVAEHAALHQSRPVGIFSIESTNRIIASRILAAEALVPVKRVLSGPLSSEQYQGILEAERRLKDAPIFIDAVQQLNIEQLVSLATQAHEDEQLDLLVVDYVQLLRDFSQKYKSREEEFDAIVRSLKHLARELEIPVIAVSQMSARSKSDLPRVDDLEGAEPLTQHADLILLIHRSQFRAEDEGESSDIADIIIAKNRQGQGATVRALFLAEVPAFRNLIG